MQWSHYEKMKFSQLKNNILGKVLISLAAFSLVFLISTAYLWRSLDKIVQTARSIPRGSTKSAFNSIGAPGIDVVYTWVNGSDHKFLEQLNRVKREYLKRLDPKYFYRSCQMCPNNLGHFIVKSDLLFLNSSTTSTLSSKSRNLLTEEGKILIHHNHASSICSSQARGNCWATYITVNCSNKKPFLEKEDRFHVVTSHVVLIASNDGINLKKFARSRLKELLGTDLTLSCDHSETTCAITIDPTKYGENSLIQQEIISVLKQFHEFSVNWPVSLVVDDNSSLCASEEDQEVEEISKNRFADNDELKYSMRSLEKFAPWIRYIFLVTNGQIPSWLNTSHPRLRLISHASIFPNKSHLPTFNSAAIESHLHRIPGLSENFIYFNDDMLLGKTAYLQDFYNEREGHKIRLAWAVPNCSPNCPAQWLSDGFCDKACNTTLCLHDGGDCLGNARTIHDSDGISWNNSLDRIHSNHAIPSSQCAPGCLDSWLADNTCDASCQNRACAYDMGDCSLIDLHKFDLLQNGSIYRVSTANSFYFNLSNFSICPCPNLVSGNYEHDLRIRKVVLNFKHKFLLVLLKSNLTDDMRLNLTFLCKTEIETNELEIKVTVVYDQSQTTQHGKQNLESTSSSTERQLDPADLSPKILFALNAKNSTDEMTFSKREGVESFPELRTNMNLTLQRIDGLDIWAKKGAFKYEKDKVLQDIARLIALEEKRQFETTPRFQSRYLLDAYTDSIVYVNYLYNKVFGVSTRRVPAHAPYFLNKNIISRLWDKFHREMDATSSHQFRSEKDMQFPLSYYYFLMSETYNLEAEKYLERFDSDNSRSLNEVEFRAFLLSLPEDRTISTIAGQAAFNWTSCPNSQGSSHKDLVPFDTILACEVFVKLIEEARSVKRNLFTLLDTRDVQFIMLRPNFSLFMRDLDNLIKNPSLMICFNDDIDKGDEKEILKIRSTLRVYYEFLFPIPSAYEMDPNLDQDDNLRRISSADSYDKRLIIFIMFIIIFCFYFRCLFHLKRKSHARVAGKNGFEDKKLFRV